MTDPKKTWKPDDEEALKALIRATVQNAGDIDPADLPSKVRERIKGRVTGATDIETYVKQVLAESAKK